MKQHYSLGFAFSLYQEDVLLIKKNRPEWQAGRSNGVGGHIEEGETPVHAMMREFHEEANLIIPEWNWHQFLQIDSEHARVHCFHTVTDDIYAYRSMTDEPCFLHRMEDRTFGVHNLEWLLAMAVDSIRNGPISSFTTYT